ncbi:hypothetical protein J2850_002312 [Azospirillum picis]|uniref:Uncharacterized protein n=1 Tax=Azospirillum picis TaxID=488438 RepID=A0ABU0MJ56_9PROT|nr:hypothetical protein [Azospirillum picis]MDQ0533251.1 hypothetical protein [Azospirillum picis]
MVGALSNPAGAIRRLTALRLLRTVRAMNTIDRTNALLRLLGPAL